MKNNEENIVKKGKRGFVHIIFGRTMIIIFLLLIQVAFLVGLMFSAGKYIPYLFGSISIFTAVMLIFVLNTKSDASVKLSWCFFIAVLPVFGALMYLFVQLDLGHRVEQRAIQKTIDEGAKFLPENNNVYEKLKTDDKGFYNLSRYMRDKGGFTAYKNTQVEYFPIGENKFKKMLEALEKAEKFIFLEYFIIKEGFMWDKILNVLLKKAKEGVEVRIIYDGTNAVSNLPYGYPKKLKKAGIQCKMFSPLRPFVSTYYNNRDHRKILVVDGVCAFCGGINLADEYINVTSPHGHWKDTAVKIEGEAVKSFTLMFLEMWNADEKNREYEKYLIESVRTDENGIVIPYGDNPMDDELLAENVYLDLINRAEKYVYIMTPYLILDGQMENALKFASKRGVDVRIILPQKPDHIYAYVLAEDHYPELIKAGVKIYTYTPGFVHAKEFLVDDKYGIVGTINLDYRSLYLHFECGLLMYKPDCIEKMYEDFEETFEKCHIINQGDIKKRGFLSRLAGKMLKAVAPLM